MRNSLYLFIKLKVIYLYNQERGTVMEKCKQCGNELREVGNLLVCDKCHKTEKEFRSR